MSRIHSHEIIPGKGFDQVKLGMTKDEVINALGNPDEREEDTHPDGGFSETFFYYDEGFDLTFESVNNNRLSYISVFHEAFHINNEIRIGMSKDEVLDVISAMGFSEPSVEDMGEEALPGNELLYLEEENINFWFSYDKMDEIQFGPFWKDLDTPIWP